MDCSKKCFKLVWWCHQLLSGFLSSDHLPIVSCQSHLSVMIRVIMRWYWSCARSPGIYLTAEQNPLKPQQVDHRWRLYNQSSPQMGYLNSKWDWQDHTSFQEGNKNDRRKGRKNCGFKPDWVLILSRCLSPEKKILWEKLKTVDSSLKFLFKVWFPCQLKFYSFKILMLKPLMSNIMYFIFIPWEI